MRNPDAPLFIPLRREFFDAFAAGSKREEWRRLGPCWNATTCRIGRPVVLALGYTRTRLEGVVTGFRIAPAAGAAGELYGTGTPCAVIAVTLAGDI